MKKFFLMLIPLCILGYFAIKRDTDSRRKLKKEIVCNNVRIYWYRELGWTEIYNTVIAVENGRKATILREPDTGLFDVGCRNDTIRLTAQAFLTSYIKQKKVFGHPVVIDTTGN